MLYKLVRFVCFVTCQHVSVILLISVVLRMFIGATNVRLEGTNGIAPLQMLVVHTPEEPR